MSTVTFPQEIDGLRPAVYCRESYGKAVRVLLMKWFLTLSAVIALAAAIAGPFFGVGYVAPIALVGFMALLTAANLDRIAEFKASRSGFEAKTRDLLDRAEVTIDKLQMLAKTVATLSLSLVKRTGRWGGYSDTEQNAFRNETLDVLRGIGVSEAEISLVLRDWQRTEEFDYAHMILGGSRIPEGIDNDGVGEWNALRNGGIETIPSPADIRAFLQKYQLAMDGVLDLLDDYTYYQKHRTHRRPDVWSRRQNWGHLKRKQ